MKKFIIATLIILSCLLLFVACNNDTTDNNTNDDTSQSTEKVFTVNVNYVYRNTIIKTLTDEKKAGDAYNYTKYEQNTPEGYVKDDNVESFFPDDYPKGTQGYNKGVLDVTYQIKPKYEHYMQITTTNSNTNGKIIPFAVLGLYIGNDPYTINDFNGEPVTFRLSEITEIKMFNTYSYYYNRLVSYGNGLTNNFGTIMEVNNKALKNLVKVDMTDCTFLEDLPSNFFSGIPSLKTVKSNGNTKKLQQIGSNFLSGNENLEFLDLDFSAVTKVGKEFLMNSLINYTNELTLNFSSLKDNGLLFMYQCSNNVNAPTVKLILGDTQWNNDWFIYDKSWGTSDYAHNLNQTDHADARCSAINLTVYTNYKGNIETAVSTFAGTTTNIVVADMPNA
ncbi:MAG: hypothetical protein NC350_04010 [Corallococcus sp.]|nr:hypothetical protein [Corallococcus sp.]